MRTPVPLETIGAVEFPRLAVAVNPAIGSQADRRERLFDIGVYEGEHLPREDFVELIRVHVQSSDLRPNSYHTKSRSSIKMYDPSDFGFVT